MLFREGYGAPRFLSICLSSRRHNTSCEGELRLKIGARIGEGAGGGRSIRFKAKSGHYPFLALFSGVRGRVILRSSQVRSSKKFLSRVLNEEKLSPTERRRWLE